jgi:hypothetical protein
MNSDAQIEKINTFKALVEEDDEDTALIFLNMANWDEMVI